MVDHSMDTPFTNVEKPSTVSGRIPTELISPDSLLVNALYVEISLPVLVASCKKELNNYLRGEPYTDIYGVKLIRRAIVQGDQETRTSVQSCFSGVVLDWLRRHPQRSHAYCLASEENYLAQTFERFWQLTISNQQVESITLTAVLHYLRASLHSAILDTLRTSVRPGKIPKPLPGEPH
jgi:hypothetical protein